MVSVIAGAIPQRFLIAIHALMDFRYLAQAPVIDDSVCEAINNCLAVFHAHKDAVLEVGARVGKGNRPIENWYIPKLELLQSIVTSIRESGAVYQWSADITEHAHITEIKHPAKFGNNQKYEAQICRSLDRTDKICRFELAISLRDSSIMDDDDENWIDDTDTNPTPASVFIPRRKLVDYFQKADRLSCGQIPNAPLPYRTFYNSSTAFHLTRDPTYGKLSVDSAATQFGIADLCPALADYLRRVSVTRSNVLPTSTISGRQISQPRCVLPFESLQVWSRVRIQQKQVHAPSRVSDPRALLAEPPSEEWSLGHFDTALINTDFNYQWPASGLLGKY